MLVCVGGRRREAEERVSKGVENTEARAGKQMGAGYKNMAATRGVAARGRRGLVVFRLQPDERLRPGGDRMQHLTCNKTSGGHQVATACSI